MRFDESVNSLQSRFSAVYVYIYIPHHRTQARYRFPLGDCPSQGGTFSQMAAFAHPQTIIQVDHLEANRSAEHGWSISGSLFFRVVGDTTYEDLISRWCTNTKVAQEDVAFMELMLLIESPKSAGFTASAWVIQLEPTLQEILEVDFVVDLTTT